jgi:hypothetical protein
MGYRIDATMAALFFRDNRAIVSLGFSAGWGLSILGRIRMQDIKRIRTRISLTPVTPRFLFEGLPLNGVYIPENP